uniref:Magnesium transporter n=1 Tax=Mucochytrium quahogii TaxID=96639 RepID=A0A7S2SER4_9STRA|mmetsp:Transcript_19375/g.31896  ORF Transcript_19375/g.31896 Transcript_19375/m.31896 type:complete len:471 (+) Transcript_19375:170-1582(+)
MVGIKTVAGSLIEIFGADLCIVVGLAVQKIAVMKLIEKNRLSSAEEEVGYSDPSRINSDFGPLTEETNSEVMTVVSEQSMRAENSINDTQVPDGCELFSNFGWLMGLLIFALGNIFELVALSFASQTDIALLSNCTLIWNAVISVFIFKEDFNMRPVYRECSTRFFQRWDAFHCFVLIVGSGVAVMFTPDPPKEEDPDAKELLHMWTAAPYCYWGAFMVVAMFFTALFLVKNWRNLKTGNLNAALIAGLCGFVAAFCVTLSKVATTLISKSISGENQFDSPEAIFMVALWAFMLVSQLALLNVGLGAFEQGVVIPIYEIVGTIATIISGLLFYKTYNKFDQTDWTGFSMGVLMMCWGVWLVAHREVHTQQELSDNLHKNLSAVDDLLRVTSFSSSTNPSQAYVPFLPPQEVGSRADLYENALRSAAVSHDLPPPSFKPPTQSLAVSGAAQGGTEVDDYYEYRMYNFANDR